MPDEKPIIEYETPSEEHAKRGIAPYVVFWACCLLAVLGCLLVFNGSRNDTILGIVVAVPSGLGAIVLPLLVHFRQSS